MPSILLVDDNEYGLAARSRILTDLGYQIRKAQSAEEALQLLESGEHTFDLMVTDFRMLAMDGVELIGRAKVLRPAMKTVLLSGFVEPLGLTEENTGADAVIAKSAVEAAHLTRTVKVLLARRVPRKPAASEKRPAAKSMVKSL